MSNIQLNNITFKFSELKISKILDFFFPIGGACYRNLKEKENRKQKQNNY